MQHKINHPTTNALNDEWADTHSRRSIPLHYRPLTGAQALARINSLSKSERDRFMLELLELAQQGNTTATRTLLQAMLPKAIRNARTARALREETVQDAVSISISAMFTSIATYRVDTWRSSVAAVLGLKAIGIINGASTSVETFSGYETDEIEALVNDSFDDTERDPFEAESTPFHAIMKVLSWALDSGVLSREEVQILANFELGDRRERAELVERMNTTREALRKRALRLRQKLGQAIAADGFEL